MVNPISITDLTGFQRDVLVAIPSVETPKGLAIKSQLQTYYNEEINHGRLYPNLDQLVEKGLVKKGRIDRRTNRYELTEDGKELLRGYGEWVMSKGQPS